ncbi:MAG: hypothetical protein CHACPFDD_02553 [Phycisphaerae bacterium]|nr:hypothetical protein [Phycisphaerae bacterium]
MSGVAQPGSPGNRLTILFTSVGRRVELLQAFRAAAGRLGVDLRLIGADSSPTAPALYCVDEPLVCPPIRDAQYIPALCEAIRRHRVDALVPTIDTDLIVLGEHRARFEAEGCVPILSDVEIVRVCRDKLEAYAFFRRHGVDTPETLTLPLSGSPSYPLFIKPRFGSAGRLALKVECVEDLNYCLKHVSEPIVQEFVQGVEHTLDVYVGLTGAVRCVVPRARWQVRGGEVSKGVVVKDPEIMAAGQRVVELLGRGLRGVITIQCMVTPDRRIRFIEINPRFGGGCPLGIAAGADFPLWLMQELRGETPTIAFDGFTHGLAMLRYDWSVFVPTDSNLALHTARPPRTIPPF